VYRHDCHDDRVCRRRTSWKADPIRLANHRVCHHLAFGKHCQLPLLVAIGAQSWANAVYILALLLFWVVSIVVLLFGTYISRTREYVQKRQVY
jgi:hypothetical protein